MKYTCKLATLSWSERCSCVQGSCYCIFRTCFMPSLAVRWFSWLMFEISLMVPVALINLIMNCLEHKNPSLLLEGRVGSSPIITAWILRHFCSVLFAEDVTEFCNDPQLQSRRLIHPAQPYGLSLIHVTAFSPTTMPRDHFVLEWPPQCIIRL